MENIKVRKVKREDSKRIWEIRNHPLARQNSNNQEETPFAKHNQWFENKYFRGGDNHCFVLEGEGEVVGYCRFDFDSDNYNYVVSIAVDADYQGIGLGKALLSEALEAFGVRGKEVVAQTLKNNILSGKFFKKNNFKIFKEDDNSYYHLL